MSDEHGLWIPEEKFAALMRALEKIASGDLSTRISISDSRDEVDAIAFGINLLADEIRFRQSEENKHARKLEAALIELRETQGQLIQSAKMAALGEFSSGLAHEINNPLMIIRGYIKDVEARLGDHQSTDVILARLNKIHASIDRMAKIVKHVQDFARPNERWGRSRVSLNDIITSALELVSEQARMRSIPIDVQFSEPAAFVEASPVALEQVILNLVANACDSIEARVQSGGGLIRICTESFLKEAIFRIHDNGVGISPEHLEKIYRPFFTTKPAGRGTGLGLSISHRIVSAYEGRIQCESTLGRGATFAVYLPAVAVGE